MKIAVWSGPRNLSTAMMYSFGARPDCTVMDEPFYAAYLVATGLHHPMRDAIIASQPTDPARVADLCTRAPGTPHLYMKHMAHHMLDGFPLDWTRDCVNIHLIRHPARVVASYGAKRDSITDADIGFAAQRALFDRIGGIVVDSADIRADPPGMLRTLCAAIGLPFDPAMLHWPAGGHPDDGVWALHWYGAVHASTGFAGTEGPLPTVTGPAAARVSYAMPHYVALATLALKKIEDV